MEKNWPPERIAEVLEYSGKATLGPCPVCNNRGLVKRLIGTIYETDSPEERADAWRDVDCPHCGNFARRARTDLPDAVREVQRLQAENAELRKDKERLDWLETFIETGVLETGFELDGGIHLTLSTIGDDREIVYREQNTLRAAIDAAKEPK